MSRDPGFLLPLQAAMPPVTAAPIPVAGSGGNVAFASQLLLTSYVASAVAIPFMLWLSGRLAGARDGANVDFHPLPPYLQLMLRKHA